MPGAHRADDLRFCTAYTIVENQTTVFVNNKLWAVEGDPNSHGEGRLYAFFGAKNIYVENILIICAPGDKASEDEEGHMPSLVDPSTASSDTIVYG
jgi:hypothetical protein